MQRLAGPDRIATSVALSVEGWGAADAAVLASAADFPDALTAGPLAMAVDGPLLLSAPDALSTPVADELARLDVGTVYLAGGQQALSAAVEVELTARGYEVVRLAGEERTATARAIAERIVALRGDAETVVLARSDAFADALAASSVAATGVVPVLLTGSDALSETTGQALADLLPEGATVVLAGGAAALSPAVEQAVTDAGFVADRRGGDDRWATAAALRASAGERGGGGLDPLVLASGTAFPDALGAGVLAARLGGGLLLVDPSDLDTSPASAAALDGAAPDWVLVAGGPAAISDRVLDQVRAALAG